MLEMTEEAEAPMVSVRHEHYFIDREFRGSGFVVYVAPSLTPGLHHVAVYEAAGGDEEGAYIGETPTALPPRTPEEALAWARRIQSGIRSTTFVKEVLR